MAQASGVGVHLDPRLDDISVSLRLRKSTALQALDLLAILYTLEFDVRYGVLSAGRPQRLFRMTSSPPDSEPCTIPTQGHWRRQELSAAGADLLRKLDRLVVDLDFADAPLSDVIAFIRDFSDVNLVLKPDVGQIPVHLKAKGLAVGSVLEMLFLPMGLDLKIEGNAVIIFTRL